MIDFNNLASCEKRSLTTFCDRAKALMSRRMLKNGLPKIELKETISLNPPTFECEATLPDEEEFRSFLIDLRTFISEKEPNYFYKVYNILHRKLNDKALKDKLVLVRKEFSQALKQGPISIINGTKKYTPKYIINLYLNGRYFHDDEEKRIELEELEHSLGGEAELKFIFHECARKLIKCIYILHQLIRENVNNLGF
ncbi:MAG: hypothetical protein H0Z39_07210 [Peptococcaceae bacterium]|nr:hypothetical protein [Peptococcaceae bacterium]